MIKLYNIQSDITRGFSKFLTSSIPNLRKTQLNFLPSLLFGMINSESCASSDIAKSLKDELKWAQYDSVVKRINRFWSNKLFNGKDITFDHMFSKDNYTIFMFSMRIGTQGIPIYFDCFKGINNTDAFKIETILKGIDAIDALFKNRGFELVFLADRWFNSTDIVNIMLLFIKTL